MVDNVLVFGFTPAEHWSRLRKVLERISASVITLKKNVNLHVVRLNA